MMVAYQDHDLKTNFAALVRGKLDYDTPISKYTWFKTGGNADILFTPEDVQDLACFKKPFRMMLKFCHWVWAQTC